MRLFLSLTAAGLALAGCAIPVATPVQPPVIVAPSPAPVGSAQRAAATTVVNREMASRLPGVNVAPYTACVINNATMAEIADLASLSGNNAGAASAVASIVQRPAATQCIAGVARVA